MVQVEEVKEPLLLKKSGFGWRLSPPQILVLGFALVILTGAVLLSLPAADNKGKTDFLTALFTATSATCVTGLVVVDTGTHWSNFGQIIILLLIQVGGLGIMTMSTLFAILLGRSINLRERLIIQEALNQISLAGVVRLVKYILIFTFLIEIFFGLILSFRWFFDFGWQGLWPGFFHAVSAFNNAGFDIFGSFRSLTTYREDITVNLAITTLIILGGLGFTVVVDIYNRRNFKALVLHSKLALLVTFLLLAGGTMFFFLLEWNNSLKPLTLPGKVMASYFQAVTPRTAGFNTLDIGKLLPATQFLIIILMFIGASPVSTGGGIKTTTFGLLILSAWSLIRGRDDVEFFQRRLPKEQIYKAIAILLMSVSLVVTVTILLTITEKADFLTVLFETVSAFGTVGLSMGLTPHLSETGRILIILTMFAGRLGPLTIAFALARQRQAVAIRYPQEKIIIG